VDVGYFVLPPVRPGGDTPVFGGGDFAGAFRDRPEVREFLRWVLNPEWGRLWAANPGGQFLPANAEFDVGHCRATGLDEDVNALRLRLCQEVRNGVAAGLWRFDASDLMPTNVGSVTDAGTPGAFYQGMLDYVDGGPDNLDRILADIEAAWPDSARP
jgi:alpha-glucoside transport system substrate-binding protein